MPPPAPDAILAEGEHGMFRDRQDAGRVLGEAVAALGLRRPVVLAVPRGGVPVAAEVAARLGAPLDIVVARKIGAPTDRELALGAVAEGPEPVVVRNEDLIAATGTRAAEFRAVLDEEIAEMARRRRLYGGGRRPLDLDGRDAVLVDDGIATGASIRAAIAAVRARRPAQLILAVPVAPADMVAALGPSVDDLVCPEQPVSFGAVGAHYRDFAPVEDATVLDILAAFRAGGGASRVADV